MSTVCAPTSGTAARDVDTDSLVKRAMVFGALQALACLGLVTNVIATARQIPLLAQGHSALADLNRLDHIRASSATATLILGLLGAVAFLVWIHRAVKNQEAIAEPPPRWSPAGTVGRLLIPVYNFYVFYRAFQGLWLSSDPARRMDEENPAIGLLIILGVALAVSDRLVAHEFEELSRSVTLSGLGGWSRPSIGTIQTAFGHLLALQIGWLASVILHTCLVAAITIRQHRYRWARER